MPRASTLIDATRTTPVLSPFDEKTEIFKVTYRPEAITAEFDAKLVAPETTDLDICKMLAENILVGWDLTEDDDKTVIPITAEYLQKNLGSRTIIRVVASMRADMNPEKKSKTPSRGISSATALEDSDD
jgi:hypothetical protein